MKLLLGVVLSICLVGLVYAAETSGATYTSPNGHADDFACWLNEQDYVDHTHSVDQPDDKAGYALGPGLDLVIYEASGEREGIKKIVPDEVIVESKWDLRNEQGSTYLVAKYNLWDMFKNKKQ